MKKSAKLLVILFLIATLALTACGAPEAAPAEEAPAEEAAPAEEEAPAEEPAEPTGKVCIALDSGGVFCVDPAQRPFTGDKVVFFVPGRVAAEGGPGFHARRKDAA